MCGAALRESRLHRVREVCGRKRHYFVHAGNLIFLAAINQTDMMNLRALSIVASAFGIAYNLLQPVPLFAPAAWGMFFVSCHVYYAGQLIKERQHITLTPEEEEVYEKGFLRYGFTPRQFTDILEHAHCVWNTFRSGEWIHREGDRREEVTLLISGEAEAVNASGGFMWKVAPGQGAWLGDFFNPNFVAKSPESRTKVRLHPVSWRCVALECRTMSLSTDHLYSHLASNPRLEAAACRTQIHDLKGKVKRSMPDFCLHTYRQMLEVATSDGSICNKERDLLSSWRERHQIDDSAHVAALAELGWSDKEFQAGKRNRWS